LRQAGRELNAVPNHKIAALARLFRNGHAKARVTVFAAGLRRSGLVDINLLPIDQGEAPLPTSQGFLEFERDRVDEVVVLTAIEGVRFLLRVVSI